MSDFSGLIYDLKNHNGFGLLANVWNHKFDGITSALKDYDYYVDNSKYYYLGNQLNGILSYQNNKEVQSVIDNLNSTISDSFKEIVKIIDEQKEELEEFEEFAGQFSKFNSFVWTMISWKKTGKKDRQSYREEFSQYEDEFLKNAKHMKDLGFYDDYDLQMINELFELLYTPNEELSL